MLNCSLHSDRRHDHSIEADEQQKCEAHSIPKCRRKLAVWSPTGVIEDWPTRLVFDSLTRSPYSCLLQQRQQSYISFSQNTIYIFSCFTLHSTFNKVAFSLAALRWGSSCKSPGWQTYNDSRWSGWTSIHWQWQWQCPQNKKWDEKTKHEMIWKWGEHDKLVW
jgi:hypothetical protein